MNNNTSTNNKFVVDEQLSKSEEFSNNQKSVKNVGILLAAGLGSRFNKKMHKQYIKINGKEAISYGINCLKSSKKLDKVIVVLEEEMLINGRIKREYNVETIKGGNSRAESFQNAMDYIDENYKECEKVIFHEAARPLLNSDIVDKYMGILDEYDYVETCQHITDSLGSFLEGIPKREDYFLIQAPEAYRYRILREYFDVNSDVYFAAYQLPKSSKGYKFFEVGPNYKLTYPEDLDLIEFFCRKNHI